MHYEKLCLYASDKDSNKQLDNGETIEIVNVNNKDNAITPKNLIVFDKDKEEFELELNVDVRLKDDNTDFINVIANLKGVQSAVLVSYNGEYMG